MTTSTQPRSTTRTRALVLGGGGVAGIAWETGLLIGLAHAGTDLSDADLVVGTSAGSVVATALRAGRLEDAAPAPAEDAQASAGADEVAPQPGAAHPEGDGDRPGPGQEGPDREATGFDGMRFMAMMQSAAQGATDPQDARARLGEQVRPVQVSLSEEAWVGRMAGRLPGEWPQGRLAITAVDALDGAFRVFDADSGVDLARAVAASCTVPSVFPLVHIDGRPHMDGGMRSATNADVAAGHDAVLVIACSPEMPTSPYGPTLGEAVEELRRDGEVLVIEADEASRVAFGTNVLAQESAGPAFAAGLAQGRSVAAQVRALWG